MTRTGQTVLWVLAALCTAAVPSCTSLPEADPPPAAPAPEATGGPAPPEANAPATSVKPELTSENSTAAQGEPLPTQPTPASADVLPEPVLRVFSAARFTVSTRAEWVEAGGNYRQDYGAALSLVPEGEATGRALDIYREAVYVSEAARAAAVEHTLTALVPVAAGWKGERPAPENIEGRELAAVTVTNADSPQRLLEHRVWVTEDGIYTFSLSTRVANREADVAVLHDCVRSFTFGDLAAARAAQREQLAFGFGRPENWLLDIQGARAVLRGPLRLGQDGKLAANQSSITVTTSGKAHGTPQARAAHVRGIAETLVAGTADAAKPPTAAWGEQTGLVSATMEIEPPAGGLTGSGRRKVIVVFGNRHTFVIAHNHDVSDLTATGSLRTFLERFAEVK